LRLILGGCDRRSFCKIVGTILEENGRGYWETSDQNLEMLKDLYQELEDRIEGVE